MGDNLISSVVTVATGIVGLAVIAVLVSKNAQTGSVIQAGGNAFSNAISAAVGPVTGGTSTFTGGGASYM